MTGPFNIQAQDTLQTILDEKLCDKKLFQDIVVNIRLLKLVKGGRITICKDETGTRVESSVWTNGVERVIIEALENGGQDD